MQPGMKHCRTYFLDWAFFRDSWNSSGVKPFTTTSFLPDPMTITGTPLLLYLPVNSSIDFASTSTSRLMKGILFLVKYSFVSFQCGHHATENKTIRGYVLASSALAG